MPAPDILKSVLPALGSALLGVGAAAWVLPLPDSGLAASERRTTGGPAAGNPADGWSVATAQAQLDFLRKAGNPTAQMAAALGFASLSSTAEIRALLDLAPGFPANAAGTLAVEVLLKRWVGLDPAGALEYCRVHFPKSLPKLIGTWSQTDPAKAEAFLPFFKGPILSREVDAYLNVRASNTSDSVIEAWMDALPPGEVRTAAEAAWKRRQELPPPPPDLSTPASLVGLYRNGARVEADDHRISQLNAAQLGEMLAEAPEGKLRSSGDILTGLAKTNPAVAAEWLTTVPMDKTTAPKAAQFSATWAQEDPAAAAGWVASLPAGDLAVNAATNVARQYHRNAPEEAAAWAAQLPPGPVQEAAHKVMAGK